MKKLLMWSCLIVYLFITAYTSPKENKSKQEKFPVTSPIVMDTIYIKEYVADIHSLKNVEIRARVHGEIVKVHVDEGQMVKKDNTLL